jgi:IS30 family transposase
MAKRSYITQKEVAAIQAGAEQGYTDQAIADELCRSRPGVTRWRLHLERGAIINGKPLPFSFKDLAELARKK